MKTMEIIKELNSLGSQSIKNVLIKHGARELFYGVKVEDVKQISKKLIWVTLHARCLLHLIILKKLSTQSMYFV